MKRSNGVILATVVVFLVVGVLYIQSKTDPYAVRRSPPIETPQPTLTNPPTVEDLQNEVKNQGEKESSGAMNVTGKKFGEATRGDPNPTGQWYDNEEPEEESETSSSDGGGD